MKTIAQRLLAMLLLIVVIGALGLMVRQFASMQWLVENETRMRDFVRNDPVQGWLVGLVIYTLFSLIPGTAGKSVVFGWVFGFWAAVLIVDVGLTCAATVSFFAARFLTRDWVLGRLGGLIIRLDRTIQHDGWFFLIMVRVAHVPFTMVNYAAGATSLRFPVFLWTTSLGLLPGTMIFVFIGTRIPTLAMISEKGVWQLLDPLLFGLLASTIVFPILIRLAMARFRRPGIGNTVEIEELESLESWKVLRRSDASH